MSKPKMDNVLPSYAGPLSEHEEKGDFKITKSPSQIIKLPDGMYANTHSYHRIKIIGKCMEQIGIHKEDEWLASKFSNSEKKNLKKGDVLLIYLREQNRYKIRCFDYYDNNKDLITYSYKNNEKKISNKPHKLSSVLGIVKYKLS